jgi:myo-inositol-1(or 4)-monophosphatase
VEEKSLYNLVTEADLGAEKLILSEIQKNFPTDGILAEEGGAIEAALGRSGFTWVVDPLDGTTNYTHGLPLYGISLGLVDSDSMVPLFGIVFFPELHTYYHSIRGEGAFREKKQISVSKTNQLKDSLFVTGFPYDRNQSLDALLSYYKTILQKSRGIRRTGAATLDLCWLAEGKFDGYYELGLKPWDMAAGALLVSEAGGKLSTMDGNDFDIMTPSLLATNGILHEYLLNEFQEQVNRVVY